MKHAYAELFTAKLNDTSLVLFEKHEEWKEWREVAKSDLVFAVGGNFDYFLCLPQHKEDCLHWLNGSDLIQDSQYVDGKYSDVEASLNPSFDTHGDLFMTTERNIRIKPEKEKRWILVNAIDNFQPRMFDDEGDANHMLQGSHPNWSKHEIEVEVTG